MESYTGGSNWTSRTYRVREGQIGQVRRIVYGREFILKESYFMPLRGIKYDPFKMNALLLLQILYYEASLHNIIFAIVLFVL